MSFTSTFDNCSINGFKALSGQYSQLQILVPSDSANLDMFGTAVALSNAGNFLVIGSQRSQANLTEQVYVYEKQNNYTYSNEIILQQSVSTYGDFFGFNVDISNDSNIIAVGAYGYNNQGAVYIFNKSGNTWTQANILTASDAANNDSFGFSISLNASGNYLAIGAPSEDTSPNTNNGAVYIFTRSGNIWSQQAKLTSTPRENSATFGTAVAMSNDSNYCFISAPEASGGGGLYLFRRSGNTWTQVDAETIGNSTQDVGRSIAINDNADRIYVNSQNPTQSLFSIGRTGNTLSLLQTINLSSVGNLTSDGNTKSISCISNGNSVVAGLSITGKAIQINQINPNANTLQINQVLQGSNNLSSQQLSSVDISNDASVIVLGYPDLSVPSYPGQVYIFVNG